MFPSEMCSYWPFRAVVYQLQYALEVNGKIVDNEAYGSKDISSKIIEKLKAKGLTILPESVQTTFYQAMLLESMYSATILKLFSRKDADALAGILKANLAKKWKGQLNIFASSCFCVVID
jgi:hypothetical protein